MTTSGVVAGRYPARYSYVGAEVDKITAALGPPEARRVKSDRFSTLEEFAC
jgi:hypothetical protein